MSGAPPEEYLAVLKASYDYDPQSDDEIAIKENQILFLLERVDEDWWKVKLKGESQDVDNPSGLVPAAYVEQADHTSVVKALYDYEASAPGELSISEDDILLVFETEDEWILVQSSKEGGKAGFVPANYVEPYSGEDEEQPAPQQQIVVPPSPPPVAAPYVDPAERVAASKASADDIKTWSVSEVDKKGKKTKGTLGIGSGAVFFASETSKAAVQKWPTDTITNINIEKSKHVHFDVGDPAPTSLHFNAGSKDNAEAIVTKLESSRAMAIEANTESTNVPTATTRAPPPPAIDTASSKVAKASVHFAPNSPQIIPPREPSEDDEEEEPEEPVYEDGEIAVALYTFTADGEDELSVAEGEKLLVIEKDGDEWWKCRNEHGNEGVVPASYIELASTQGKSSSSQPVARDNEEEDNAAKEAEARAQAEEAAAEAERAQQEEERKEKDRRKKEAQERAKAAAAAADADRKRRKEAAAAQQKKPSPPPASRPSTSDSKSRTDSSTGRNSLDNGPPPPDRVRIWHDRSGQFRVEAALLSFKDGKLRLHKTNGVIVEVPSEKMSIEDMRFVEKLMSKKSRPQVSKKLSDDDIPLALQRPNSTGDRSSKAIPAKKVPTIDWFDFFLTAGCDIDDCTRYAASFERDKMDESILPDITESVLRSLGLREGDIIRVMKAVEKRKPQPPAADKNKEQIAKDEEYAKQLQAQDNRGPPNLFSGPGGVLKPSRRGRPQPSKSLPSGVDLNAINAVSDKIQRTESPQLLSPTNTTPISAAQVPPRASSAAPTINGFDDDAWTNRPSSTKPLAPTPPIPTARAPSAPPAPVQVAAPAAAVAPAASASSPSLAKTTEADIFDQLARLSQLRQNTTPQAPAPAPTGTPLSNPSSIPPAPTPPTVSVGYQSGLGVGNSPVPIGQHLQAQQTGIYNGARGPYAPVPANQGLLQPLIPTQTGFNNFVPTRPNGNILNASSPLGGQSQQQSFLLPQQTGFPGSQPLISQQTGFPGSQHVLSQPTGVPFGNFNGGYNAVNPFGTGSIVTNPTGFNPGFGQNLNGFSSPPPVPPLPSSPPTNNTNPANIFAQMKSGTFATDNDTSGPQGANKYDALRPNGLAPQPTGWGGFQGSYVGYH